MTAAAVERHDDEDLLGLYLEQIAAVPLLSAAEEVELAVAMEAGVLAAERLGKHDADPHLAEELQTLVVLGERARSRMVRANLRLVVASARRLRGHDLPLVDLIQEGNLGLLRAVAKFDYRRGCKFSTYAVWWIRQAMTRGVAASARTIRLPVHVMGRLNLCLAVRRRLSIELGRPPTTDEVAEHSGLTGDEVRELLRHDVEPISLDTPLSVCGDLGDAVVDPDAADPSDFAASVIMQERLRDAVRSLSGLEQAIVLRRFGFCGPALGAQAVANELGLSRDRVRYVESQALRKLRRIPSAAGLRTFWRP